MGKVTGDRVKQAREITGLSREAMAAQLGVEPLELVDIEADYAQPSADVLSRLALGTGFPVKFFYKPPGPDFPLGSLLFRGLA